MENKPLKICIMGASTSTNNRGVSALAVSLVKIFLTLDHNAKLTFITGSRNSQPQRINLAEKELLIPTVGYRLSPKAPLHQHLFFIFVIAILQRCIPFRKTREKLISRNPVLNSMYNADFIADIQGGDSFSDIYGLPGFMLGTLPMLIALLLRKKLVLLPQTYGPYKSRVAKAIAAYIVSRSFYSFSRDKKGLQFLQRAMHNGTSDFSFCPDVAFMLDPIIPAKVVIVPEMAERKKPLVGFNINGLMYNGGYTRNNMFSLAIDYNILVVDVAKLILSQNACVLLIPHTYGLSNNVNSDPSACDEIVKLIGSDSLHVLKGEYNQSELKSIIGTCDFFIGSRMHACIAALSQGIPTVGVAYSEKFVGVFDSVGAGEMVVDCRSSSYESIINIIKNQYSGRSKAGQQNKKRIEEIRAEILRQFSRLQSVLQKDASGLQDYTFR